MSRNRKEIDVSGMKVTEARNRPQGWAKDEWSSEYLDKVVETDEKIVEHFVIVQHVREWDSETKDSTTYPITRYYRRTHTAQKFLCIGGPLHGQRKPIHDGDGQGYATFNRASFMSRKNPGGKIRVVAVWKKDLGEK